jgi:DNA polymerase III subunit delta'
MSVLPWQTAVWQRLCEVADRNRLGHALLLTGVAGLGKLSLAQLFRRYLLCEQPNTTTQQACGVCRACQLSAANHHPDAMDVTPEEGKQHISVDQIRALCQRMMRTTHGHQGRVVCLYPAESMTQNAANSLLKTLEEPPPNSVFLLLSQRWSVLPPTIVSRCQRLHCPLPNDEEALQWLQSQNPDDAEHWQYALDYAAGAPLTASTLLTSGEWKRHQEWLARWQAVSEGQQLPTAAAEAMLPKKTDQRLAVFKHLLRWWLTALALMIKNQALKKECPAWWQGKSAHDLQVFYQRLFTVFQQVDQVALNAQLQLEALLITWQYGEEE